MNIFNFANLEKQQEPPYAPFDPDTELDKLKSLPKDQRRSAVAEFKEIMLDQKKGLADTISRLYSNIQQDSNLSAEELMKEVILNSPKYRFTIEQINKFRKALNKYESSHRVIQKYKDKSPEEIFESCFGQKPEGGACHEVWGNDYFDDL